jgi:hypothetical protein
VHTTTPSTALIPAVRSMLAELSPGTPLSNIRTLSETVGESVAARRFTMLLLASRYCSRSPACMACCPTASLGAGRRSACGWR